MLRHKAALAMHARMHALKSSSGLQDADLDDGKGDLYPFHRNLGKQDKAGEVKPYKLRNHECAMDGFNENSL